MGNKAVFYRSAILCVLLLYNSTSETANVSFIKPEIVIPRAAPAFHNLFMVMGCVFDINTVHKTVEKLTFQAFYSSSHSCK